MKGFLHLLEVLQRGAGGSCLADAVLSVSALIWKDETLCKHESGNLVMVPVGTVTQYPSGLWRSSVICLLKHQVSIRSSIFKRGFLSSFALCSVPKLKFRLALADLMGLFLNRDFWL